jgi:transaldolase
MMWQDVTHNANVRRAVFLDRDGVLNEPVIRDGKPFPPQDAADLVVCAGAKEALEGLRAAGFALICVTNQPDVARGTTSPAAIEAIHARLRAELPLDDIIVCPHDDVDACVCRKPKPGLLHEGARRHGIDPDSSYLVGDRWRDIEAGTAAHCRTIFVDRGYDERAPSVRPDVRVANIVEAATWIIADARSTMNATESSALASSVQELRIKLFADGADLDGIAKLAADPLIAGFTTNPTLMRKAGITHYADFGRKALGLVGGRPISFEVFADEPREMLRHARELASWGENVYVKIPVTDTNGLSMSSVVRELTAEGVRLNVTALMTEEQVTDVCTSLAGTAGAYVSVFAGRIADTGRDPIPLMQRNARICDRVPNVELIWASPRELLNVFQADAAGVHVITATHDILAKLELVGKNLTAYSRETVIMFYKDALAAGFTL